MQNDVILYLLAEVIRRYEKPSGDRWSLYQGYNALLAFHGRIKQLGILPSSVYGTAYPDAGNIYKVASQYDPG
jgi:hypothetical protein